MVKGLPTLAWVARHSLATPWNRLAAEPVQASWRAVSRAIMAATWPSMSAPIRLMSAEAAVIRSVSTWN